MTIEYNLTPLGKKMPRFHFEEGKGKYVSRSIHGGEQIYSFGS